MEYTKHELETLHRIHISMLKKIDEFCKENDIKYFLMYGTLIGAVRHKGFIPWDDDVDIGMLREDYNKFMKLAKNGFKGDLLIENYKMHKGYGHNFGKVVLKGTVWEEYFAEGLDCLNGIYIDVFPIDKTSNNKLLQMKQWIVCIVLVRMLLLNTKYHYRKRGIKKILYSIGYKVSGLFSKEWLVTKLEKNATKYNNSNCNKRIPFQENYSMKKQLFDDDAFKEVIPCSFENIEVMIPKRYDEILSINYGDYMKLPPKEQQVAHHSIKTIDFGIYENAKSG